MDELPPPEPIPSADLEHETEMMAVLDKNIDPETLTHLDNARAVIRQLGA